MLAPRREGTTKETRECSLVFAFFFSFERVGSLGLGVFCRCLFLSMEFARRLTWICSKMYVDLPIPSLISFLVLPCLEMSIISSLKVWYSSSIRKPCNTSLLFAVLLVVLLLFCCVFEIDDVSGLCNYDGSPIMGATPE